MITSKLAVVGASTALFLAAAAPVLANEGSAKVKGPEMKINRQGKVVVNHGKVMAVGPSSLTIDIHGLVWTVNVNDKTNVVRRYGGSSGLAEFAAGDYVNVHGKVVPAQLAIDATLLRDDSTRAAAINGKISGTAAPDMFTVTSGKKTWSVKLAPDAKIMIRDTRKTFADLAVGMRVHVKGYVNVLSSLVTGYKVNVR